LFVQFEALNPRVDVSGLALAPKKTAAVYCSVKAGLRTFGGIIEGDGIR